MDEILMALIKDDKNLLLRRDELIGKLDEKVPANLRRDYIAIRKALELNVGEIFAVGSSDRDSARYKALKVLSSSGLSEQRIDFVIKTFSRVLGWNENSNAQTDSLIERVEKLESTFGYVYNVLDSFNVVYSLIPRIEKLESTLANVRADNKNLTTQIDAMNKRLQALENKPTKNSSTNDATKNFEFLDEFNELIKLSGQEFISARDKFFSKYFAKGFECENILTRIKKPDTPPIFKSKKNYKTADYWAIRISKDEYAVVPSVKVYNYHYHFDRSMGEVFYSNFRTGYTYENISVKRPAIFECKGDVWTLKEKGGLKLS